MNELSTQPTMTVKEVSEVLNVNSKTVLRAIKKLYPHIIQNGKTTYLSEYQVTRIKEQIFKNAYLDNSVEVTTELCLLMPVGHVQVLQHRTIVLRLSPHARGSCSM